MTRNLLSIKDLTELEIPKTISMRLKCCKCGHTARYNFTTIYLDLEAYKESAKPTDFLSFGDYFRCRKCQSAWPWEFTSDAYLAAMALMVSKNAGIEDDRMVVACPRMFDGSRYCSPAQAEDYLSAILEKEPENWYVWSRLGNIYERSGMWNKAVQAFATAIEFNPNDLESHHSLGAILYDRKQYRRAADHLHRSVLLAHDATDLPDDLARGIVRSSLGMLCEIEAATKGKTRVLPPLPRRNTSESDRDQLEIDCFDLSDDTDLERLIDQILERPAQKRGDTPVPREESVGKVGRNEPCPCGSGNKFKRCCGR